MTNPVPPPADRSAEGAHTRLDAINFDVGQLQTEMRQTRGSLNTVEQGYTQLGGRVDGLETRFGSTEQGIEDSFRQVDTYLHGEFLTSHVDPRIQQQPSRPANVWSRAWRQREAAMQTTNQPQQGAAQQTGAGTSQQGVLGMRVGPIVAIGITALLALILLSGGVNFNFRLGSGTQQADTKPPPSPYAGGAHAAPMSDRDLAGMAYRNLGSTPTGQQPNWAGVIPNNSSFRRPDNGVPCKKVNESRASGWIFDRWACPRNQTVGM